MSENPQFIPPPPPIQPPFTPNRLIHPQKQNKGKPFAIASLIVVGIGVLPLLVYLFQCLFVMEGSNNALMLLLMGFIGFIIHLIGTICGVIGMSTGEKTLGLIGTIGNGAILAVILVGGFLGLVLS